MTMENIKIRYEKAVNALKGVMVANIVGKNIPDDKQEEKIANEFYSSMQEYVKNVSCIKKFTGVSVSFVEVLSHLSSYKPFTIESEQGSVTFIHGAPNGNVAIEGENGEPQSVSYASKEFADLVEVQETYIVSCYPGGKSAEWETSGKRFFNIGNELRPIGLAVEGDILYIGYVSPYHQQFIEKEFGKL